MFVKSAEFDRLEACLPDVNKPCELLGGYHTREEWARVGPSGIAYEQWTFHCTCAIGWECGRGTCHRYKAKEA